VFSYEQEIFAIGVEKASGDRLLLGDGYLFLISSLIHFPIGALRH